MTEYVAEVDGSHRVIRKTRGSSDSARTYSFESVYPLDTWIWGFMERVCRIDTFRTSLGVQKTEGVRGG